jgi:hypothetical protein
MRVFTESRVRRHLPGSSHSLQRHSRCCEKFILIVIGTVIRRTSRAVHLTVGKTDSCNSRNVLQANRRFTNNMLADKDIKY